MLEEVMDKLIQPEALIVLVNHSSPLIQQGVMKVGPVSSLSLEHCDIGRSLNSTALLMLIDNKVSPNSRLRLRGALKAQLLAVITFGKSMARCFPLFSFFMLS